MGKGVGDGRRVPGPLRERETGRDDNLNDRKVGCRNAPKLAITGWRGDKGGCGEREAGGNGRKGETQCAAYIPWGPGANFLFWLAFKLNLRGGRSWRVTAVNGPRKRSQIAGRLLRRRSPTLIYRLDSPSALSLSCLALAWTYVAKLFGSTTRTRVGK